MRSERLKAGWHEYPYPTSIPTQIHLPNDNGKSSGVKAYIKTNMAAPKFQDMEIGRPNQPIKFTKFESGTSCKR
jgi:hypothetical protein